MLVESLVKPTHVPYSFNEYQEKGTNVVLELSPDYETDDDIKNFQNLWVEALKQIFKEDTNITINPKLFTSHDELNKYVYDLKFDFENPEQNVVVGIILPTPNAPTSMTLLYNASS